MAEVDLARDGEGRVVITIRGELDITSTPDIDAAVGPSISDGAPRLILDLSGVRFADSSALAMWVKWATTAESIETRGASQLLRTVIDRMNLAGTLGLR
jgi:anti-anti-sigma factor